MSDRPPTPSIFATQFDIPSISADVARWDKAWEHVLSTISAHDDVFPVLSKICTINQPGTSTNPRLGMQRKLHSQVSRAQGLVSKLWEEMFKRSLVMILLFMKKAQRKRHILNGLRDACDRSSLGEDARALCPELTSTNMLHRNGQRFIMFVVEMSTEVRQIGPGRVAWLWSNWWQKAVDMPQPWSVDVRFAFAQLSLQRNEFLTGFVLHTLISIMKENNYTSPIADLVTSDTFFSSSFWTTTTTTTTTTSTATGILETNVLHCAYCTGTAEEFNKGRKFMMCSICKSKLNLPVQYCSRECQKADWNQHKIHCGKSRQVSSVPKDRYWQFKFSEIPDHVLDTMPPAHGDIFLNGTVFGKPGGPLRTPVLLRQIALLQADKTADYFLFDAADRPIRFATSDNDMWIRMTFRIFRDEAMYSRIMDGQVEGMAEYLIKLMADTPGLGKERILAQFGREYAVDMPSRMAELRDRKTGYGFPLGKTFLESMARSRMPKAMMEPLHSRSAPRRALLTM